jgi:hypothetical protein
MMPDTSERRIQIIACFLIIIGLTAVAFGSLYHWEALTGAGNTVVGYGGALLTGKALQQLTSKGGGDIVNQPPKDA